MERTLIADAVRRVGKTVRLCGWVDRRRDHGKLVFLDLRDRTGVVQVVGHSGLGDLHISDVLEIEGAVKKRPPAMVNPKISTGEVEIFVEKMKVLAKSAELPFDMSLPDLNVELPTLLDWRALSLRHPKVQAIFKVQEAIIDGFRKTLKNLGFTEFQAPTIVPVATEGGAEIFPIKYYDYNAYLCQSPQLYKQILVGVYERVFSVARAYRAEPSITTRHLSEYISLDVEMGFIRSYEELMEVAEALFRGIFKEVEERCQAELKLYQASIPLMSKEIPRLKMREAQEIIFKRTGVDHRQEPDLAPEDEKEICRWALEEKGSELVFITHYPTSKRPFYAYPDPEDPDYTLSFDMLGRGVEWVTGGQRIHDYDFLVKRIKERGNDPKDFDLYLQAFKFGMPPEGGFALGAERITMHILGLGNIREASLFPRDMERVDVRLATFHKTSVPNSHKAGEAVFNKIISLLKKGNFPYKEYTHPPVQTSLKAARVRGTRLEQGAKSLVMYADNKPVMAVISAAKKIDIEAFKQVFAFKNLRLATAQEVERLTGLPIGAVPPFGGFFNMATYVEKGLGENMEIAFNAGLCTRSLKMNYKDWLKIVKPKLGSFAR